MSSSLVKFATEKKSHDGKKLFWDRVSLDGLPYRGTHAPTYGEDEWDLKTVRVGDYRNAFFDVMDETQNRNFCAVMERCLNGWFRLIHLERFWVDTDGKRTAFHYVEWAEYYLEDGTRTPYVSPGIMELANGQQQLLGSNVG